MPGSEFSMDKINPTQKINNKIDGTPKPETKKVKVSSQDDDIVSFSSGLFSISVFFLS